MSTCVLCIKEISSEHLTSYQAHEDLIENFRICDAIKEYFQQFKILSDFSTNFICHSCFSTLKSFKELQNLVLETYTNLQTLIHQEDFTKTGETIINIEMKHCNNNGITNEECLNEEIDLDCIQINENSQDQLSSRRKHPANDIEGERKIRDFIDIKCHICSSNFDSFNDLCKHFKATHPIHRACLICCNKKFTQRSILLEHLEYHDNSRVHRCEICDKKFKTRAIRKSHMRNFHSNTQHEQSKCQECGKLFKNKYILKTHMYKHSVDESRTFECYICARSVKNFELLREHFRNKHNLNGQKSYVCHICSKIVTRIDIHFKQVHESEPIERIKCEICNHWLKKTSLKGHMATHNESGFSCEICKKFLKNRNTYFCHMKRVHTVGKFKCEFCEKSFHNEGRLADHIACQHTGDFIHHCRVEGCEKMFRNSGRRRMHERRIHPNEYEAFKPMYLRDHVDY